MTDIPDEILDDLYLGPITASQNRRVLEKVRVDLSRFKANYLCREK